MYQCFCDFFAKSNTHQQYLPRNYQVIYKIR